MTTSPPDIVHVSSAHPWTDNRVHLREAAGAAAAGYAVRLIAVESDVTTQETGVEVVTIPRRRRRARMTFGSAQAVGLAVRSRARVCHLHDPELVWAVPLLRALGRRVVFDAHEDLPDQVASKAYVSRRAARPARALAQLVVRLVSTADRVVAATETIADAYPASKTVLVRNYPRLRAEEASAIEPSRRPPVVAYVGALTANRGSAAVAGLTLSPAFPHGWRLELAGHVSAPEAAELTARPRADDLPLVFHGRLSPEATRDLLLDARVGIVVFEPTAAHLNSLPTKLFEYMAAGLAVVVSDFPLWRRLLGHLDCATFVDPADVDAVARAVAAYDADPDLLDRHGRNGRRAALETFSWDGEEATLLGLYRDLIGSPTPGGRAPEGAS
jgi:glycosyltransferase involved in cell wall biosynthesis